MPHLGLPNPPLASLQDLLQAHHNTLVMWTLSRLCELVQELVKAALGPAECVCPAFHSVHVASRRELDVKFHLPLQYDAVLDII